MTGPADAIVLAGGRSSRLGGRDKAGLELGGRRLVDRAVAAARSAGVQRCVVAGPPSLVVDAWLVREEPPFGGPVAGIAAALQALGDASPDDAVLVLACDLAEPANAVAALLAAVRRPADGVDGLHLVDEAGRAQWLAGIYRRGALEAALARLGAPTGRSVRDLMSPLVLRPVPTDGCNVTDIDTWEDWRTARHRDRTSERTKDTPMSDLPPIQAWVEHLCATLGVDPNAVELRALLDTTRDVAHHVDRPSAPVSAFIVGLAAAREGGTPEAVRAACESASAAARAWEAP